MSKIFQLVGVLVAIYFLAVRILMLYTKCSEGEAKEMIASWLKENMSGSRNASYELSKDSSYRDEVNDKVKDILGEARYYELCRLGKSSPTMQFVDDQVGPPRVGVTLNCTNENERKRLEAILEGTTTQHLLNYEDLDLANVDVLSYWSQNRILHLPMLIIMYSRNERERKMLDRKKQSSISRITAKYGDVYDDTEEVDLFE